MTTPAFSLSDTLDLLERTPAVVNALLRGTSARIILEYGESRAFEPFDLFAQFSRFTGWSLDALLDCFSELRRLNVETVRGWDLTDEQLAMTGRHPALGSVTLRQLLATWAVHDLNHLAQISRLMGKRYAVEVGPWSEYLRILNL